MKTLTEFAAVTLKNALKTQAELTTAGKTAEELPAAMGEALKLEGEKISHLVSALGLLNGKKTQDLKRVVVLKLNEGEKAPSGAQLIGENYFNVEFYPSLQPARGDREERGARGGRDGKGKGKGKGRGGKGGERGGRPPRGERTERAERPAATPSGIGATPAALKAAAELKESGGRHPRGEPRTPRAPKAPRPPKAPRVDTPTGPPTIKLKDGTVFMPRTTGVTVPQPKTETQEAPSTESLAAAPTEAAES